MRRREPPRAAPRPIPGSAPTFFVPHASDIAQAESVWQGTVAFMRQNGFDVDGSQRIYCLAYTHDGRECVDVVGEMDRYGEQEVLVILRTFPPGPSLICTAHRGVIAGHPILGPADAIVIPFAKE